jgi:hypothetical protein
VHDGIEPPLGERPIDEGGVGKIADDQRRAFVDGFTMTLEQTVENDDLVSGLAKGADTVASNVTRPSRYKDSHDFDISPIQRFDILTF